MKNIKRSKGLVSGIYCIINLVNSKIYIGSSNCIYSRIRYHLGALRANKHHTKYLQNSFNKYGEDMFYTIILEEVPVKDLIQREEHWIILLDADYNVIRTNLSQPSLSLSEDKKKSISNKLKQYHKDGLFDFMKKQIYVYNLDGSFHSEYNSCKECALTLEFNNKGFYDYFYRGFTHYKEFQFSFEYVESMNPIEIISHSEERRLEASNRMKNNSINIGRKECRESRDKRNKTLKLVSSGVKINQYDENMNFIKEWNNFKEIVDSIGCNIHTIKRNLRGTTKFTKYGIFKWSN